MFARSSALGSKTLAGLCTVALAVTLVILPMSQSSVGADAPMSRAKDKGTGVDTIVTVSGRQLRVDGKPFTIRGVGYAPTPIGDDPEVASPHGDYFTSDYSALYNRDLALLRQMGANTVRLWGWKTSADHSDFLDAAYNNGNHPIYVIASYWLNANVNISDPAVRQGIKGEFTEMVAVHKNHPAVLMWAIGNELNAPWMYGDRDDLFSLIDEMAQAAPLEEGSKPHPVTTPLADINLNHTIANRDPEVPNLDVWSVQVYRGSSFGSLFSDYTAASGKPLVITEYGIDAYDDKHGDEYEHIGLPYQAIYAESLWKEIAANSSVWATTGAPSAASDTRRARSSLDAVPV
jgi:beta-galactosidase/beta-glucuronidase